jgi:hypothetical protein
MGQPGAGRCPTVELTELALRGDPTLRRPCPADKVGKKGAAAVGRLVHVSASYGPNFAQPGVAEQVS